MTFVDNNGGRNGRSSRRGSSTSSHLLRLRSLRDSVSSTDQIDHVKDGIIARPSSSSSRQYKRRRGNYVKIDADSADESADAKDRIEPTDCVSSSSPFDCQRGRRHRNYVQIDADSADGSADVDDGIEPTDYLSSEDIKDIEASHRNYSSGSADGGLHFSSSTERISNGRRFRSVSSTTNHNHSGSEEDYGDRGPQLLTASERSEAVALMISHQRLKDPSDAGINLESSHRSCSTRSTRTASSRGSGSSTGRPRSVNAALDHHTEPSPRRDLWLALAVSQAVSVGSLHQASTGRGHDSVPRSGAEAAALTLSYISLALSLAVGAGFLHRPLREHITSDAKFVITMEQLLALLLLLTTSAHAGLVLNPNSGGNGDYLAVAESEVLNANLFCAAWAGLYGSAGLAADAFFGAREGTSSVARWCMAFFSSLCASAALLEAYTGPGCRGPLLAGSSYCVVALNVGMLDLCGAVLALLCGAVTLFLRRRDGGGDGPRSCWAGLIASSVLLIVHSVNVGLASSPGGPGTDAGSVFVTSWLAWIYSAILYKTAVESLVIGPATPAAAVKSLEKEHKAMHRRRTARLNEGSHRSGAEDTYATDEDATDEDATDDESKPDSSRRAPDALLCAMEEGSDASHSEVLPFPESTSRSWGDDDGGRRHPLDLDRSLGSEGSDDDCTQVNPEGRPYDRRQIDPDGRYGLRDAAAVLHDPEADHDGRRPRPPRDKPEGYDPRNCARNATDCYEPTSGLDGAAGARHGQREHMWEDPSAGRSPILRDPSSHDDDAGPAQHYLRRDQSVSQRDAANHVASQQSMDVDREWDFDTLDTPRDPRRAGHNTETAQARAVPMAREPSPKPSPTPGMTRRASWDSLMSNFSPIQEASVETSPSTQTSTMENVGPSNRSSVEASPSAEVSTVRSVILSKHSSSRSGSDPLSRSGSGSRSTRSRSWRKSRSKSTKSGSTKSTGKSGRRPNPRRGRKTPPPPQPPRPSKGEKDQGVVREDSGTSSSFPATVEVDSLMSSSVPATVEVDSATSLSVPTTVEGAASAKKPSHGSSSDHPKTANESLDDYIASKNPARAARERTVPAACASGSVSTSSSDFNMVVSEDQSLVTELTQEGFDDRKSSDVFHLSSSARNALAAAKYVIAITRADREKEAAGRREPSHAYRSARKGSQATASAHRASSNLPPSLPERLPLYNGSDASGPSEAPAPAGYESEAIAMAEASLARAMESAQTYRSYVEDVASSTEDEGQGSAVRRRQRELRRKRGGVNRPGRSRGAGGRQRKKLSRSGAPSTGGGQQDFRIAARDSQRYRSPAVSRSDDSGLWV